MIKPSKTSAKSLACIPQGAKQQRWKHHKGDDVVSKHSSCLTLLSVLPCCGSPWGQIRAAPFFFDTRRLFKMCEPAFWLGRDCLHMQGKTQAATGTSEPGPSQWVENGVKLDLGFSSSLSCCLQNLFACWQINHGLSLKISDCRLENKPKIPCLLRWLGRIDSDLCYDASTHRYSSNFLAAGSQKHGRLQQLPAVTPGEGHLEGPDTQHTSTSSPADARTSTCYSADVQEGGEAKDNFSREVLK